MINNSDLIKEIDQEKSFSFADIINCQYKDKFFEHEHIDFSFVIDKNIINENKIEKRIRFGSYRMKIPRPNLA